MPMRHRDMELPMFTTFTSLATTPDIGPQELRIELLFPADDATDRARRALAGSWYSRAPWLPDLLRWPSYRCS